MPIRHRKLVQLVNKAAAGSPLDNREAQFLYGCLIDQSKRLDAPTVERVVKLTGRSYARTPKMAALALLAYATPDKPVEAIG